MQKYASKKGIWGWMSFDWASQPYHTLLMTFIFAPYFTSAVASDAVNGQAAWASMLTITGIGIAVLAPILGSIADNSGPRKPWIMVFSVMYVVGAFGLWWAVPGMVSLTWILIAFGVGLVGAEFAAIFVNAILPELGPKEDLGRISGSGWAFGYWGGLLVLVLMLLLLAENDAGLTLLQKPPIFGLDAVMREGTRAVGPLSSLWYALFIIPFFLWVPDVKKRPLQKGIISKSFSDLWATLKTLPSQTSLSAYLGSSMLYRDALNGLYAFGGIYASGVLGWSIPQIGVFGILALITGAIFAWLGGFADKKFGPKTVIFWCIIVLIMVCTTIISTSREMAFFIPLTAGSSAPDIIFYICGAVIGGAGGALQATSRTMLVYQANPARMTEAFGLYALSGKATAFLAPFTILLATSLTGSQRLGMSPLIGLFIIGLILLIWVKPNGAEAE
ncbi:MAG: MFS transporter [Paracoccaceae bacterium]